MKRRIRLGEATPMKLGLLAIGLIVWALSTPVSLPAAGSLFLVYSTYLGGSPGGGGYLDGTGDGNQHAYGLAVDGEGHIYVTGETAAPDFPLANPLYSALDGWNPFVARLDPIGLIYSTLLPGTRGLYLPDIDQKVGFNAGAGIAVDASGNTYVAGYTLSGAMPTTENTYQGAFAGRADGFVMKVDPQGNLVYATYLGGSGLDAAIGIAVDVSGNAYVAGFTGSQDFPTVHALQPVHRGGTLFGGLDGFVAKLDPSGAALVYATYLGGSGDEACFGIAVNAAGQAHVSGPTSSSDFPTESAYQADFAGGKNSLGLPADGFVAKLDPSGAALVYATYLGGSGGEYLNPVSDFARIAVDASDNAYVTSSTSSADFPTTANAFQPTYGDNSDAYVAKLNPAGGLVYATYLGGSGAERGLGLAVDASGSAYVAGYTGSEDFPIVDGLQSRFAGGGDGFIARLDPGGSALLFSTYLGGSDDDRCKDIALDKEGNVYVIGDTRSSDFPTTENAFQSSPAEEGRENVFVVKMGAPNTAVTEEYTAVFPQSFSLEQNFPNPFNAGTVIRFSLPASEEVELVLYNLMGQEVATLVKGRRGAGEHAVRWDGRDGSGHELTSGTYLYRLRAGGQVETRKLVLLR